MLLPGDPAPRFHARTTFNQKLSFDLLAGRYIVLCFFGSAAHSAVGRVLDQVEQHRERFAQPDALFLGVSADPEDERSGRVAQRWPGIEYVWDFDLSVSRAYGAAFAEGPRYLPHVLILDRGMRVAAVLPFDQDV